jgi:tripartite motif-containing protein 71
MRSTTKGILGLSLILLGVAGRDAESYDAMKLLDPIKLDEAGRPVAVAASDDRYYVLDEKKGQVLIYDESGKLIKITGRDGNAKGAFSAPRGVALGPDGRVYVADTGNDRIQILNQDGDFKGSFGTRGGEPGQLKAPQSVAVGQDGRVYVADTGNDRIQVFTDQGILLFQFGVAGREAGQFKSPTKVAVDAGDNIFVLDSGNNRIQKFDSAALPVAPEFSLQGQDFAMDAYGFFYVLDSKSGRVFEQNPSGYIQGKFGSVGSGQGQSKKAEGVAVSPDGRVLVVDTGNKRLLRVDLANKAKTSIVPSNLQTKVLVAGPSRVIDAAATALAFSGSDLYAWIPKDQQFAVIGPDGKEKSRVGVKGGKGPSATKDTKGFAVGEAGMYVSDTPLNRIQNFSKDGKWKANIAESTGFFDSTKKEGRVSEPHGVAISDQGTVYVANAGSARVDAFNPEGVFLFGVGPTVGIVELKQPVAVAWDNQRFLYVLDRSAKKIVKTEPSGAYLASWGALGRGPGQLQDPVSMAFDGNTYLYVLDAALRRVSVYEKEDGRWVTDLFSGGKDERSLMEPVAIAIEGSRLMIADKGRGPRSWPSTCASC